MNLSLFDQLFAFLLFFAGLLILYYLGRIFIAEILVLFGKHQLPGVGIAFRKSVSSLKNADRFLNIREHDKAIAELKKAFIFLNPHDIQQISQIREHHQNILTRIILLGDDGNCHFENISQLERLLLERTELQQLLLKADTAFGEIRARRTDGGKSLPKWGKQEFQVKIRQIEEQLTINRSELEKEIHLLSVYFHQRPANKEMLQ